MKTSDIIPLADTPEDAKNELVWKIYLFNENRNYYICTRYGGIRDLQKFAEIFGEDFEIEKWMLLYFPENDLNTKIKDNSNQTSSRSKIKFIVLHRWK